MPNYRRVFVPGGTYFFTLVSYQRRKILCTPSVHSALRQSIRIVQRKRPFKIVAWVLMPDHLHCIWILPQDDEDFSSRWGMIKRKVTQTCNELDRCGPPNGNSRFKRHEGTIWQRRFWERLVRDPTDLDRCLDYIHWNPVKHGFVSRVSDWPYSTFHRFVQNGSYPANWGGNGLDDLHDEQFGE